MTNIFEQATRRKLRFNHNGILTVEQLWDISIKNINGKYESLLDDIYQKIQSQYTNTESLFGSNEMSEDDKLRCDIIKHIVKTKIEEHKARLDANTRSQKRQEIMALMADKKTEAMSQKSLDELQAMLEEL